METGQSRTVIKESNPDFSEARCQCGQLVAKLGIGGVELKCKRCKRLVSIPFTAFSQSTEVTFQLCTTTPSSRTSS